MQYRRWFCYLIFVKPFVAYAQSVITLYDRDDKINSSAPVVAVKMLVLLCTFIPAQGISCFTHNLLPLSRMDRIGVKVVLIKLLVPLLQLQQTVIEGKIYLLTDFLVEIKVIHDLDDVSARNRGSRLIGVLFCVEMMFIAALTNYAYHAADLCNWKKRQKLQWQLDHRKLKNEAHPKHNDLNQSFVRKKYTLVLGLKRRPYAFFHFIAKQNKTKNKNYKTFHQDLKASLKEDDDFDKDGELLTAHIFETESNT
ncbi:hypothetical protein RFI_13643 [Reticulomyxa filosa]|uniref:Uncharacterized protein n=1 Tax=Reticulomyxa filosa TaxID=46433 RepID=X6NBZ1_RETFI|nr:hypothetical protein RFI_13643 [Reticulomyxa filosa]|eukprot:ETO23536.1 hypothetical protein RFI_13643 [Reticulomyxa filosa]